MAIAARAPVRRPILVEDDVLEALFLTAFLGGPAALLLAALVATRERNAAQAAQTAPRCRCQESSPDTSAPPSRSGS